MSQRWRLRFGDQTFGPFDRRELESLLAEGRLSPSSLLATEGEGTWQHAGDVAGLAGLFSGPVPERKAKPPRIVGDAASDTTMLHVTYALYAASFLIGFSVLIGAILAYVKRGDVTGSWQQSHYQWLIRTFWIWLLFMAIGGVTSLFGIGWLIIVAISIWLLYRVIKGWVLVGQLRAIADPTAWL